MIASVLSRVVWFAAGFLVACAVNCAEVEVRNHSSFVCEVWFGGDIETEPVLYSIGTGVVAVLESDLTNMWCSVGGSYEAAESFEVGGSHRVQVGGNSSEPSFIVWEIHSVAHWFWIGGMFGALCGVGNWVSLWLRRVPSGFERVTD